MESAQSSDRRQTKGIQVNKIKRIGSVKTGSGGQALPFSQATEAGGFIFVSGQVGMGKDGEIVTGGIVAQTRKTLDNIAAILTKANCTLADVVKVTAWLDDTRDFQAFNRAYASYFAEHLPARSCVRSQIMVDAKVEIDVIAYRSAAG
jgi:reactive intermediate/imine deaminase